MVTIFLNHFKFFNCFLFFLLLGNTIIAKNAKTKKQTSNKNNLNQVSNIIVGIDTSHQD